jgi:hypothetical protein
MEQYIETTQITRRIRKKQQNFQEVFSQNVSFGVRNTELQTRLLLSQFEKVVLQISLLFSLLETFNIIIK